MAFKCTSLACDCEFSCILRPCDALWWLMKRLQEPVWGSVRAGRTNSEVIVVTFVT